MWHTIIIIGNLGRDPEMRYTAAGQEVTSLNVAVNDDYTDKAGVRVKRTIWMRVSVWGKQAESCSKFLQKGSKVMVEGRLTPAEDGGPRMFQRKDGSWAASYDMSASTVRFLSSRTEGTGSGEDAGAAGGGGEEEIPF